MKGLVHSSPEGGASIPTALDLAVRFSFFAILGFGPWWLAVEFLYA